MLGSDSTVFPALKVFVVFILSREVGEASPPGWLPGVASATWKQMGAGPPSLAGLAAVLIIPEQPV